MLKVQSHGQRIRVVNPVTFKGTEMINVQFIEEGRSGGNAQMSESTSFLDSIIGEDSGIGNLRVHTHPVRADKIALFPIGRTLQGHINRSLYSQPIMRQQKGVPARMIDGKITYFSTYLSSEPIEDRDLRLSTQELLAIDPNAFKNVQLGSAVVEVLDIPQAVGQQLENVLQGQQPHGGENLG